MFNVNRPVLQIDLAEFSGSGPTPSQTAKIVTTLPEAVITPRTLRIAKGETVWQTIDGLETVVLLLASELKQVFNEGIQYRFDLGVMTITCIARNNELTVTDIIVGGTRMSQLTLDSDSVLLRHLGVTRYVSYTLSELL